MAKLVISLYALVLAHSATFDVSYAFLSTYSEKLKSTSTNFKTEVKFAIEEAKAVVTEYAKLFKTLQSSASSFQKEVSDNINDTMTGFWKSVNGFLTTATVDVSKCVALTFAIESKATDILIDTNTCIHNKLNKVEVYIEKSTASVECMLARLESLENIADDSLAQVMKKKKNMITVYQTKMFLNSISHEPSHIITKIFSTLTEATLVISRIESLMISDCVSIEAISSLINDTQNVGSKVETCIADLNSSDANSQSLSTNSLHFWKR